MERSGIDAVRLVQIDVEGSEISLDNVMTNVLKTRAADRMPIVSQ